jgi:hypothetical protein
MAHLNHRGPEEKGPKTGRLLGKCNKTEEDKKKQDVSRLGQGMGKKMKAGCNEGKGSRSRASEIFD